jgi:hypothetical protein
VETVLVRLSCLSFEAGPSACQSQWTYGQAWLASTPHWSFRALNVARLAPSRAVIYGLEAELRRPVNRWHVTLLMRL